MTTTTFFIIFIPILSILLLSVNLLLAPHNPYQEKDSVFECGFHSFLGQNRTQFNISFFIFGLLFLLFDLEILLVYPYSVSSYTNDIYGLIIMMLFFVLLTLGFIFELGKNALTIDSKQTSISNSKNTPNIFVFTGTLLQSVIPFNSIFFIASLRVAQKKMGSSTQRRSYSTGLPRIYPIKVYDNADVDKSLILKENTNKSGIYRWVNTNNNQSYVGSSVDLRVRFVSYYNINHIISNSSMLICRALYKYNYSSFRLEILEYCKVEHLIDRENSYIKLLKPEYNIVQESHTLPSRLGHVHTKSTLEKMSKSSPDRITITVKDILTDTEKTYDSTTLWLKQRKI